MNTSRFYFLQNNFFFEGLFFKIIEIDITFRPISWVVHAWTLGWSNYWFRIINLMKFMVPKMGMSLTNKEWHSCDLVFKIWRYTFWLRHLLTFLWKWSLCMKWGFKLLLLEKRLIYFKGVITMWKLLFSHQRLLGNTTKLLR